MLITGRLKIHVNKMSTPPKRQRLSCTENDTVDRENVDEETEGEEDSAGIEEVVQEQVIEQVQEPIKVAVEVGQPPKEAPKYVDKKGEDTEDDDGNSSSDEINEEGGEKKYANPLDDPLNCRLRHLNDDCLLSICEYLSARDLLRLYDVDDYYKDLITDKVIPHILVDFTSTGGYWSTNKIFSTFGAKMRRIKISQENTLCSFRRFLEFVIDYCTPERLTELHLRYRSADSSGIMHIMNKAMPYFKKLTKLVLSSTESAAEYGSFVDSLGKTSVELKVFHLSGVGLTPTWCEIESFNKLEEFRILDGNILRQLSTSIESLPDFLKAKHDLKIFDYAGRDDISESTRVLGEHCHKLEVYGDHCTARYFPGFNREPHPAFGDKYVRYIHMSTLPYIKHLSITAYSNQANDIHRTLMKLKQPSKIKSLSILINRDGKDDSNDTVLLNDATNWVSRLTNQSFEQLKAVELKFISDTSDTHSFQCDLLCKFLMTLPNLSKLRVTGDRPMQNISKILGFVPHLQHLNVANARMIHLPAEMLKVYRNLRKIIAIRTAEQRRIHLVLSVHQLREIQVDIFLLFSLAFGP